MFQYWRDGALNNLSFNILDRILKFPNVYTLHSEYFSTANLTIEVRTK